MAKKKLTLNDEVIEVGDIIVDVPFRIPLMVTKVSSGSVMMINVSCGDLYDERKVNLQGTILDTYAKQAFELLDDPNRYQLLMKYEEWRNKVHNIVKLKMKKPKKKKHAKS